MRVSEQSVYRAVPEPDAANTVGPSLPKKGRKEGKKQGSTEKKEKKKPQNINSRNKENSPNGEQNY